MITLVTYCTADGMLIRWPAPDGRIACLEYAVQEGGSWIRHVGTASAIPAETLFVLHAL
ncbi:hypothetical protein [Chloroflexus sp.]|uniref:hypothetical protein n=1 Tax=Chloroflexus sp. TaxID=1904827 RepID=UPI002ADE323D|nr:hypothetical protein [Chloroflexus sp.]